MTLNFVEKMFCINGNGTEVPTVQFYKRGFMLGGTGGSIDWKDITIKGIGSLTLVNAKANGLNYLKLFGDCVQEEKLGSVTLSGACELRELPIEYTQLEYIRATGTQYINTGYVPVIGDEIYIKYRFTTVGSVSSTFYCLLSAGASSNVNDYQLIMIEGKSTSIPAGGFFYKYFANGSATTVSFSPVVDTWYTANITSTGTLTTGGVSETSTPAGEISGDNKNLYLFIRANLASPFLGDIAEMTITNNGTTKLNLIPVKRNSDNVLGMYDTVTQRFLTNAGTGEFVAGTTIHNVPSEYTQLNYLRSNGGYIDTGYIPTVNSSIEYNVAFASVTANNCLFGTRTSGSYSSSTNQFYGGVYVANSNKIYWYSGKTRTNTDIVPENGVYYTVTCTNENMTGTPEYPIALFTLNNAGTLASSTVMDLAYFKIYESNVLVRNLLPVKRNSDNALGVYDTVTNTFFAGSGDFIAGDDKIPTPAKPMNIICNNGTLKVRNKNGLPDTYTQITYIDGGSNAYLDTGVTPVCNVLRTKWKGQLLGSTYGGSFLGCSTSTTPRAGFRFFSNANNGNFTIQSGSTIEETGVGFNPVTVDITYDNVNQTINGQINSSIISQTGVNLNLNFNKNMLLFTAYIGDNVGTSNPNRQFYLTIEKDGVIVRNLIPVQRNSDNAIGMYDTITNAFMPSIGENQFTGGNVDYSAYEVYVDGEVETVEDSLGNTATAEMLLSVDTYVDTQEVLSGNITRKCGIIVLNGSENWTQISNSSAPYALVVNDFITLGLGNKVVVYSTHFKGVPASATWSNYDNLISFTTSPSSESRTFRVRYLSNTKTLAEFKQFLAEQFAKGTPVICVYYKTATTETVESQVLEELPIIQTAGSIANLPINAVMQEPTPSTPLNIICNNGTLKFRNKNGLPSGYAQLNYVQASNGQYVNTGFYFNDLTKNYVVHLRTTIDGSTGVTGQIGYSGINGQVMLTLTSAYGLGTSGAGVPNQANHIYNVYQYRGDDASRYMVIDDVTLQQGSQSNTTENPYCIYKLSPLSSAFNAFWGKLYELQIYENNVLKINYIPCMRLSDNEIGLYDTVNEEFITNAGTGSFVSGGINVDAYEIYTDGTTETIKDSLDNTATAEMLLAVSENYRDVQEILTGEITHNVGVIVFTGNEDWLWQSTYDRFSCDIGMKIFGNRTCPLYCTHYQTIDDGRSLADVPDYSVYGASSSNNIYLHDSRYTDVTDLKAFLANEYANGTPVIVIYPLATATTETVTGQTLTTKRGTNVIEITQASIDGLPLEVSYKAGVEVTVAEVENANLDDSVTVTIGD